MPYILAFDEGTTSARTVLYNEQGRRIALESQAIPCSFPHPGWVEQDANEIWAAQIGSARALLASQKVEIDCLGITNQRETTVVWDRHSGQPISPAIVWQCRRTADFCTQLAQSPEGAGITAKTGLVIDAYFSGSKIRWILENVPGARAKAANGELLFGNVDTWLIWKLTNGSVHVTDVTNASRTMLMNLATGEWDSDLLRLLEIPAVMLPRIVPSSGIVGSTSPEHLGVEIPIAGIAGDQQAALAGQACFRPGLSKNTYGTGCFALTHTGGLLTQSPHKLLATRAASLTNDAQFAVEGSIFIAGAAVQWLRDKLGFLSSSAESEAVATSIPDTEGVYLVPAFVGLGTPYWDSAARGTITGMTLGTTRAHIVRAALEAIAFQTRDLIDAMQAGGGEPVRELRVDGGASANNFLMQFQADQLGIPVVRPADVETTALGAAYLAGLATGIWRDHVELESFWQRERVFEPSVARDQADTRYSGWKDAVRRSRGLY